jgi:hypothetical protein
MGNDYFEMRDWYDGYIINEIADLPPCSAYGVAEALI